MRSVGLVGIAVCLAAAILIGLVLLSARHSLLHGLQEVRQAEARVNMLSKQQSPTAALDGVRRYVVRAHADFHAANERLAPLAPVLSHLSWIPKIGDELAVSPAAARTADQMTDGALRLLSGLQPLARTLSDRSGGGDASMQVLVRQIAAGRPDFERACTQLQQAQRTRWQIAGSRHTGTVSSALHSFDHQLPRLLLFCRTLVLAPTLLGMDRAQTYLVAYQNSDELRATGGYIGSADLLTLRQGVPSQLFLGTTTRDNLSVPPPEPMQLYNGEPGWLFRDSNWSPDFPTTAALERFFFKLDYHRDAPAVIDVTPRAAADVLSATGPIYAPEYGRLVTAQNVARLADYYSHWAEDRGPYRFANKDTQRKQFIGIVARHVLKKLSRLSFKQWIRLASSIASGVAHRDILLNFQGSSEQALVRSVGASGEISRTSSDFLYVVDTNLSYNKINPYVHLRTSYQVHIRRDRWLDAHLTLHVANVPEPAPLARRGMGPGAGDLGGPDDYATFLRVYVPAGAELISRSGWTQPWSPGPAYGKTMFCGYLIVRRGATRTIHLHYVVPPNVFVWSHGTQYRLVVQHQPGSHPDELTVSVTPDGARTSSWKVRHPALDWVRSLSIPHLPFDPIPLSRTPLAVVAPNHWIEPHAYLRAANSRG